MTYCVDHIWGVCLVHASGAPDATLFRFGDFVTAMALLVVIFTVGDIRYRFRIQIAPTPLYLETFLLAGVIGFSTLLTDLWSREHWLVPASHITRPIWTATLGALFLGLALTWMFYAFIRPPRFGRGNAVRYARALYRVIVRGSNLELPIIADELTRSAKSLTALARIDMPRLPGMPEIPPKRRFGIFKRSRPGARDYAHDILLLLGNRKLCRCVVESSPATAIAFFEAVSVNGRLGVSLWQFSKNVSTEAILNKDSILYHEDEGFNSGLIGYLKPFSKAVYGNFELVEALGNHFGSPLDIRLDLVFSWDAEQLKAFCRAMLTSVSGYLDSGWWGRHSFALYRAFGTLEHACNDLYKLDKVQEDYYAADSVKRLGVVVDFIKDAIDTIQKSNAVPPVVLRRRNDAPANSDLTDHIAKLMSNIISSVMSVTSPSDRCWMIQHNMVWGEFFTHGGGPIWDAVRHKLRRSLYEEVRELERFPNYKSSRILGYCLNVMGFRPRERKGYGSDVYALQRVVTEWTRRNYLRLRQVHPQVADSCLMGSVTFDDASSRLVYTYSKGLNLEPPRDFLELLPPKPSE